MLELGSHYLHSRRRLGRIGGGLPSDAPGCAGGPLRNAALAAHARAHQTDRLAELVCSNSLKTDQEGSAPWLLKHELRRFDSLLLRAANLARVPGGTALTVDRALFSEEVTRAIAAEPLIELRREEACVDSGRPNLHRRYRASHQRCPSRRHRPHHGIEPPVFL